MKRFFIFAIAVALTAGYNDRAWSQGGQGGAAGGASGAGTAGGGTTGSGISTAGGVGTASPAGAGGTTTAGTPGAAGQTAPAATTNRTGTTTPAAAAGRAGTTGRIGVGANGNVGASVPVGVNVNGQVGMNPNFAFGQTPWFANPQVRQQLNLTDQQFNHLNQSYMNAWNQYLQNTRGQAAAGLQGRTTVQNPNTTQPAVTGQGRATAAAQRQAQLDAFRDRATQNTNPNAAAGLNNAAAQRELQLQRFQDRFMRDFDQSVNSTLTDPQQRMRFNQLNTQFQGLSALNNPAMQRQLDLSSAQQIQLRQLAGEFRRELGQLRRTGRTDPALLQQQFSQLQNQFNTQLNGILTAEQQQLWAQILGEQFNFPVQTFLGNEVATPGGVVTPNPGNQIATPPERAPLR